MTLKQLGRSPLSPSSPPFPSTPLLSFPPPSPVTLAISSSLPSPSPRTSWRVSSMASCWGWETRYSHRNLGAGILPQNIYLHSVLVQKQKQMQTNMRSPLYNDHLFATICVFSGIYLASYILAISVVNASINDPGLVLLTFQDAVLLIEQLMRSPIAALAYLLALIGTSQITSLIWNIGGEPVLHNFLRLDIPSWVHRAGIRMVSILSATYFLRNSGAEGLYQLLILMQVIVALLLPSSLIPLFQVATSATLMGGHRISQFFELVALIILISMLVVHLHHMSFF
ncbi:hypothetical protein MLD38_011090 [Melastoma candidum]|uniref:Uncharacterized protein n=1 Tax=Melastoma candidum TaxID=119954 RepID=A0ACB9R209_9MYRT|nr:hypothetical protein MLD38_011090 [Melastoma candidum]